MKNRRRLVSMKDLRSAYNETNREIEKLRKENALLRENLNGLAIAAMELREIKELVGPLSPAEIGEMAENHSRLLAGAKLYQLQIKDLTEQSEIDAEKIRTAEMSSLELEQALMKMTETSTAVQEGATRALKSSRKETEQLSNQLFEAEERAAKAETTLKEYQKKLGFTRLLKKGKKSRRVESEEEEQTFITYEELMKKVHEQRIALHSTRSEKNQCKIRIRELKEKLSDAEESLQKVKQENEANKAAATKWRLRAQRTRLRNEKAPKQVELAIQKRLLFSGKKKMKENNDLKNFSFEDLIQKQFRKQMSRKARTEGQLFSSCDLDRNDKLTFSEFQRGVAIMGIRPLPKSKEMYELFQSFDTDKNGTIAWKEMLQNERKNSPPRKQSSFSVAVVKTPFEKKKKSQNISNDDRNVKGNQQLAEIKENSDNGSKLSPTARLLKLASINLDDELFAKKSNKEQIGEDVLKEKTNYL
eukprot:g95.t1